MDLSCCPRKNPDVEGEIVENEILVHHPGEGEVHNLNETAAFVWNASEGNTTLEEMIDVIEAEAGEKPREEIKDDVLELVDELKQKKLLE